MNCNESVFIFLFLVFDRLQFFKSHLRFTENLIRGHREFPHNPCVPTLFALFFKKLCITVVHLLQLLSQYRCSKFHSLCELDSIMGSMGFGQMYNHVYPLFLCHICSFTFQKSSLLHLFLHFLLQPLNPPNPETSFIDSVSSFPDHVVLVVIQCTALPRWLLLLSNTLLRFLHVFSYLNTWFFIIEQCFIAWICHWLSASWRTSCLF